jgi:type IV fimbrial biogenesis protein FimT
MSRQTRNFRGGQGFTLVELMIVIAVSAILIATAIPSFGALTRNTTVSGAAGEIVGGLQFARSEAIRRGTPIIFELLPAKNEWNAHLDNSTDPAYASGTDELLRHGTYHDRITTAPTTTLYLSFSSTGAVHELQSGVPVSSALPNICLTNGADAVRLVKIRRAGSTLTLGRSRDDRAEVQAACP